MSTATSRRRMAPGADGSDVGGAAAGRQYRDAERDGKLVISATAERPAATARGCAVAAAVLFGSVAAFHVALAAGVPWGEASWGGAEADLGAGLRLASGVQAAFAAGFAAIVLRRTGHHVWAPLPQRWLPAAVWVLSAYMALGVLLNAVSRSDVERAVWTPAALSLSVLCAVVAVKSRKTTLVP